MLDWLGWFGSKCGVRNRDSKMNDVRANRERSTIILRNALHPFERVFSYKTVMYLLWFGGDNLMELTLNVTSSKREPLAFV